MINSRIELALSFDTTSVAVTPAQAILLKLNKGIPLKSPPREPGVTIRDENIKYSFNWDYKSCIILYEDVTDYDNCIGQMNKILDEVNNSVPLGKISQKLLRTFWVIPTKYDFATLESKYRSLFIGDISLFNNIFDSTIVVDSKIDSMVLHHQSGVMMIDQLQTQYRIFKLKENYPKAFLFLEATITDSSSIEYSKQDMRQYIQTAFQKCKLHADSFEKIMERRL